MQMDRRTLWSGLLAASLLVSAGCFSGSDDAGSGDEIVIGHYGSLTGSTASFGVSSDEGIKLAVEEINAAGGLEVGGKKYKLKLISEDNQSDPTQVAGTVGRLIDRKVVCVLGEVASSRSLIGGPICQKNGVPMISPASTNPAVTVPVKGGKPHDFVFRVCYTDDFQGAAAALFAFKDLGWRRVGVLVDSKSDYSRGLADGFRDAFVKLGGKAEDLIERSYSEGDPNFASQLDGFAAAKVDGLFVPGYYPDIPNLAQQVRRKGLKDQKGKDLVLLGGDGWDAQDTLKNGKDNVEGYYFANHMAVGDPQSDVERKFIAAYKAKFGKDNDSMSALSYDATRILAEAIRRAGSLDREKIRDEIGKTKAFAGVTGEITIDENHNAAKPVVIVKIENGRFKFHKSYSPADVKAVQ
jgi:branched-chain amino acid transport system substrate-binding protein